MAPVSECFPNSSMSALVSRCLSLTLAYILLMASYTSRVTSFQVRKLCTDNGIQIMTDTGVKIEPYQRSRVELILADQPLKRAKPGFSMSLKFKTTSVNGTIFYGRSNDNPDEVIAVILRGGHLIYKVQCPNLHADLKLMTRRNRPVNDGEWHDLTFNARFRKRGHKANIKVDARNQHKRYEVHCAPLNYLVLGGHNPSPSHHQYPVHTKVIHSRVNGSQHLKYLEDNNWLMDDNGHFEGCIKELTVSRYLLSPPKYYAVSNCE